MVTKVVICFDCLTVFMRKGMIMDYKDFKLTSIQIKAIRRLVHVLIP